MNNTTTILILIALLLLASLFLFGKFAEASPGQMKCTFIPSVIMGDGSAPPLPIPTPIGVIISPRNYNLLPPCQRAVIVTTTPVPN